MHWACFGIRNTAFNLFKSLRIDYSTKFLVLWLGLIDTFCDLCKRFTDKLIECHSSKVLRFDTYKDNKTRHSRNFHSRE